MAISKMIFKQKGMVLAAVNILVLAAALSLLIVSTSAKQDSQRSREQELLFAGSQFIQALESYAKPVDAAGVQLPNDLKDLLLDTRMGVERRHLRRIYVDPMTGTNAWGLVRDQRGIIGLHSMSKKMPLRKAGFSLQQDFFKNAKGYHEWVFLFPQPLILQK
jgi:type II secretory pathway pseudopilin PulG